MMLGVKKSKHFPGLPLKNEAIALVLAIFLGPFGLLYSTVRGGVILFLAVFIVASVHLAILMLFIWFSGSVWAVIATRRFNIRQLKANQSLA